jgi:hypothetical protein
LTADELEQLHRPEIPLEPWRKGESLFGRKIKRIQRKQNIERSGRDVANNPVTRSIIAEKSELRKLIANDPKLVRDFEFFTKKLGWHPEGLLQLLYFDCNMMPATPQKVIASEKRKIWAIDQKELEDLCEDISALALRLRELDKTPFSPARTAILRSPAILRSGDGDRLPIKRERYLLGVFHDLPEILGLYGRELRRKVGIKTKFWSRAREDWKGIVESARENSLYERIRSGAGQYHANRLHRLVNAARQVKHLGPYEHRALVVWLGRLRERCEKAKQLRSKTSPAVSAPLAGNAAPTPE